MSAPLSPLSLPGLGPPKVTSCYSVTSPLPPLLCEQSLIEFPRRCNGNGDTIATFFQFRRVFLFGLSLGGTLSDRVTHARLHLVCTRPEGGWGWGNEREVEADRAKAAAPLTASSTCRETHLEDDVLQHQMTRPGQQADSFPGSGVCSC